MISKRRETLDADSMFAVTSRIIRALWLFSSSRKDLSKIRNEKIFIYLFFHPLLDRVSNREFATRDFN